MRESQVIEKEEKKKRKKKPSESGKKALVTIIHKQLHSDLKSKLKLRK